MNLDFLKSSTLIVDDSDFIRAITGTLLKREGFTNLHFASDGISAIEKFKEVKPSLVILDIILPKKNGIDVLKEIRQYEPDTIMIMLSSLAAPENIQEARINGANFYLVKPFDNQYFVKVIKDFLNKNGGNK